MIPISKPFIDKEDISAVAESLYSGWITQGPKVQQFEEAFASYVSSKYACCVSSCTTALHLSLIAAGVRPGDVVITPSHSFIATANSIRHCGAEPVFVDIDLDTFNMSPKCLEKLLNEDCEVRDGRLYYKKISEVITDNSPLRYFYNIKNSSHWLNIGHVGAIVPVHQMGMPCEMNAILPLARKFNIPIVEDAACAVGSEILVSKEGAWEKIGKPHGDAACFSFHPRKVITTGEGGMVTTNNPDYNNKIRLLRHHGMSVSDVTRHGAKEVVFEEYMVTGFNYRMTDMQAAMGIAQLKKLPKILSERRNIAVLYYEKLKDVPWLKLPQEPAYCKTNWQSYPVRILDDSPLSRNRLMQYLLDNGISTRRGVMNSHQEQPYASGRSLKNSELARDSVMLLPIFNGMRTTQLKKIIETIKSA